MLRNCSIAVVAWIALAGAYAYVLRDELPMPTLAIASVIVGTAVWVGLVWIFGTRHQVRDWRARNRTARGERPLDGDLTAITGVIHPSFEPIKAPLSGRDCVIYNYDAGSARTFVGFGMTRCAVRTPLGDYFLGSFPVLQGFAKSDVDRETAMQYLQSTRFEFANILQLTKLMFKMHTEAPPLRRDWKLGEEGGRPVRPDVADETSALQECIIAPGETVTAIGRYNSGISALVSDAKEKGFLRLTRGGQEIRAQAIPWAAIRSFFGGVAIVAIANAILWFVLEQMPR
ncbi:MAG TPA: hypothetical protein VNA69_18900 [Thermoanaerobaculia bacterium]|nr:hypothetical protein [Thermoanaerobaculia bacterium]